MSELTGDEFAKEINKIDKQIKKLETRRDEIKVTGDEYILLKWGTLKGWKFESKESLALFEKYSGEGMTYGAMEQEDTDKQKELICQLIDVFNGSIQNDWTGEYMTKEGAKKYIKEYGS